MASRRRAPPAVYNDVPIVSFGLPFKGVPLMGCGTVILVRYCGRPRRSEAGIRKSKNPCETSDGGNSPS